MLGGRLRLEQPRRGHRVGHDAILLAAACPARAGERAVDLGAGVGAAGLALAARVDGVDRHAGRGRCAARGAGDGERAAQRACRAGGVRASLDVDGAGARLRGRGAASGIGRARPDESAVQRSGAATGVARPRRRLAHAGSGGALAGWVKTAARLLRPRGTLTMIWRADGLADVLRALDPAFGAVTVLPVHPKPGEPAIRVLVRATKASRAPLVLLPGLVLNDRSGRPTAEARIGAARGRGAAAGRRLDAQSCCGRDCADDCHASGRRVHAFRDQASRSGDSWRDSRCDIAAIALIRTINR